jgi:energy-coupling factor transporter ATP-binding protein EcfA2
MLKLRKLRIERFKNVLPGTEIRFSDGFNVLLGQNGTGKTTLLELISSVVRCDFSDLQGEDFAIEYEMAVEEVVIRVSLRNQRQEASDPLVPQERWRPSMAARIVETNGSEILLRVENGHLYVNDEPVDEPRMGHLLTPGLIALYIAEHGLRAVSVPLVTNFETVRFDESLDVFRMMLTPARALTVMHVLRSPPPLRILPDLNRIQSVPRSLWGKLEPLYQKDPNASRFLFLDRDLAFLALAVRTMGFASGQAHIDVLARSSRSETVDYVELGNLTFRFQFEEGGVDMISHDRLSYGQKRLLTFFCYLDMCPDVVIADELVNGLHHAWITAAVDAMGARQAFLTSQNPLLLDYLPVTSPEQVRSSFIFCRAERRDGRPRWVWENMSADDAAELFAAYEVGIEHVSEILQSRGLW